jgi:hypothetical protein
MRDNPLKPEVWKVGGEKDLWLLRTLYWTKHLKVKRKSEIPHYFLFQVNLVLQPEPPLSSNQSCTESKILGDK